MRRTHAELSGVRDALLIHFKATKLKTASSVALAAHSVLLASFVVVQGHWTERRPATARAGVNCGKHLARKKLVRLRAITGEKESGLQWR